MAAIDLQERLQKIERGLELHGLHKAQAEVDEKQGATVAKLLTALEQTPNALIQIGSLLIVKVDGVPAVRNLTQLELRHLEKNPQLLSNPARSWTHCSVNSRPLPTHFRHRRRGLSWLRQSL